VVAAVRDLRADGLRWQDVADRLDAGGPATGLGTPTRGRPPGWRRSAIDVTA
jgi:hypothetical protein